MQNFTLNIQRFTYFLIVLVLSIYIIIVAKPVLAPLAFAAFFAAMLKPLCDILEELVANRSVAIIITFILILLPIAGLLLLFGYQIATLAGDLTVLSEKMGEGFKDLIFWLGKTSGWSPKEIEDWLSESTNSLMESPFQMIGESISSTTYMITGLILTPIFTFFILLYRTAFKNFFLFQFDEYTRKRAILTMVRIEQISRRYLVGLFSVVVVLGVLNSIGLMIIGIDYAIFWGFLGGFLAIIPYIGTTLGGLFPFLYAIATSNSFWPPLAVVAFYFTIQTIEGNFISPKIIGGHVKINPFVSIIAIVVGGMVWGIAGIILAMPLIAVLRIIFLQIDLLKPVGLLLGNRLNDKADEFEKKYDEDRYRLLSYFKRIKLN